MTESQVVVGVLALVVVIVAAVFGPMLYEERKASRLLKHGTRADATVLSIRETGNLHNNQPEVKIQLEVLPPDREPFQASVTTFMSPVYLPRVQPGATIAVAYDPASRKDVALVSP